ncbi:MAG: metal ABC transporter permease [Aeriscardovia sp.]|nr:metal ABC transporter permease [Aeriscardovia sp.]MBO5633514.1 metal ABC transporter permease [Aeriscardovia sp.]
MNSTVAFTFDPNWQVILGSTFMVRAMIAGVLISLSAGVIGYFVIARKSTFAAHAVAHIGIPGATGAVLLGLPVSLGMGVFALAGSLIIGILGKKASKREVATGTILAFALGLGLMLARLSTAASQQLQSILFGSILTVTNSQLITFLIFDVLLLIITAVIYRPLLFTSVDEQVAQAKGLHTQALNLVFMALLAGSVTIAVQAVGTLLIFALLVTPSASANAIARSPRSAILLSTVICFVSIMLGLLFSAMFPTPPSFAIVTVSTIIWGVTQVVTRSKR